MTSVLDHDSYVLLTRPFQGCADLLCTRCVDDIVRIPSANSFPASSGAQTAPLRLCARVACKAGTIGEDWVA
jgi:hypothetical protein